MVKIITAKEARKESLAAAERLEIRAFMEIIKDGIDHGRTKRSFGRDITERQITILKALGYKVTRTYDTRVTKGQKLKTTISW